MPRRVQDIIPVERRTIRNVPVENQKEDEPFRVSKPKKESKKAEPEKEEQVAIKRIFTPPAIPEIIKYEGTEEKPPRAPRKKLKTTLIIFGVVIVIGVAAYFTSNYFARAVFTIKPREIPVTVNENMIAAASPIADLIAYELVSVQDSATTTLNATVGSHIESKAKGTVTFYNSFSANPWRLIAGTRFQNDAGLVYRLSGTITIPGFSKSASGAFVPGSTKAVLVADQAGENYDALPTDPPQKLRVVAYRGDPKYEIVYAKITGEVSGGFVGNKVTVNPAALASTTAILRAAIVKKTMDHLKSIVPDGYILYDNAYSGIFATPTVENSNQSNIATVSLGGTIYGILFDKNDLAAKLAGAASVDSFKGLAFDTPGMDQLSFNISNAKDFSPIKKNNLIVQIKGSFSLVGTVPVAELKNKFAGMALSDTEAVIRSYSPVIDLAKSSGQVVPPWSRIPKNPDKISIIIQN